MWRQFLFWSMTGPKQAQRFVLLWLILMGLFLYPFISESDHSENMAQPSRPPAAPTMPR